MERKLNKKFRVLSTGLLTTGMVLMLAAVATGASVSPELHADNVFCTAPTDNQTGLGLDPITKFESPSDGESSQDGITVDLDVEGGTVLSWDSGDIAVGAVIVKGGPDSNVYFYPGGATSDTDLVTPLNHGGNQPAISHVDFCAAAVSEPEPSVTPTEEPSVLPTIEESEEPEVKGETFAKPKTLATTGLESWTMALVGSGLLMLGFGLRTVPVRREE